MNKYSLFFVIPIFMIGCSGKKINEDTAVVINGHQISKAEVERDAEMIRQGILNMSPENALQGVTPELRKDAARQCITNELMLEVAEKKGIKCDSSKVDSAIAKIKARFSDKAAFQRELTMMGETEESMRRQFMDGNKLDKLLQQLLEKIDTVSLLECKDFYDKNSSKYVGNNRARASQIFMPFEKNTDSAAKKEILKKAGEILSQAKAGKNFSALASKYSSGPGSTSGGDIGWFKQGDLKPELDKPLFTMKTGEISNVIVSDVGVHIIKKTEEEAGKPLSFDEVKDHIKMVLDLKKRNSFISSYIDSLISTAKVKYIDTSLVPSAGISFKGK